MARADGTVDLFLDVNDPRGNDCSQADPPPDTDDDGTGTNCYRHRWVQNDEPDDNWCGPTAGRNFLNWYGLDVANWPDLGDPMHTNNWDVGNTSACADACFESCITIIGCVLFPGCVATCEAWWGNAIVEATKAGTLPDDLDRVLDQRLPSGYIRCRESDGNHITLDKIRWSLKHGDPVIFNESRGENNLHWAAITGIRKDSSGQIMLRIANSQPDVNWSDFKLYNSIEDVSRGIGSTWIKWVLFDGVRFTPHIYRWTKVGQPDADIMGCGRDPNL
jgi:hypothetical protein